MGIGKRIKESREKKGLTQAQLAFFIGVTPSAITNYESGTSHPKEEVLLKIFDALEVEPNYLFQDSFAQDELTYSLDEQSHIKKYRSLDDYGKKQVDTTLENEYDRCNGTDNHFIDYESALAFMRSRPMYGAGGIKLEKMEQEKVIKWANDFYGMEQDAKKYID